MDWKTRTWVLFLIGLFSISITAAQQCTVDQYDTCPDGKQILVKACLDGQYYETGASCEYTCPPAECLEDTVINCWDGTTVTTQFCVSGKIHETGKACPERIDYDPIQEGVGNKKEVSDEEKNKGIFFLVFLAFILFYIGYSMKKAEKELIEEQVKVVEEELPKIPPPVDEGKDL